MNQDTCNSGAEHDEDMAELEGRLYAQVHYEIGDNEAPASSPPPSSDVNAKNGQKPRDPKFDDKLRSVSAHCMVKNSSVNTSGKNGGRYWTGGPNSRPSSPKAHYSKRDSGVYNTLAAQIGPRNGAKNASIGNIRAAAAAARPTNKQNSNPIIPSSNKPKVFTPYKPLLSDAGVCSSSTNIDNEPMPDASESLETDTAATGLKETSKLIKNRQKNGISSSQTKRKNPFAAPPPESKKDEKRLNPFHRMRQENLKVQDKMEAKKKKNREKMAPPVKLVTIEADDDDDDEVIFLPTEPPPLICIDSSDDESPQSKRKRISAEPGTSTQLPTGGRLPGNSRCTSPTNSILSADDFIVQADRRRVENEAFCGVRAYDLLEVDRTVERILQRADIASIRADPMQDASEANDAVIFATPHRKKKEKKSKELTKSYEMSENSFAAVDVYESESSDMPDTIYAKGLTGKRKKASSSSSSEVSEDVMDVPKSKRLKKRKSSGSAKGSDFPSTDESSSENDIDDGKVADSIPYLIRGEAVGKVKKSSSKKSKKNLKRKRQQSDKLSDDEFISKLTSIVHADSEASNGDEIDESRETSNESIAARDIVKSVLQKRSKRAKKADAEVDDQPQVEIDNQPRDTVEIDDGPEEKKKKKKKKNESTVVTPDEQIEDGGDNDQPSNDHESYAADKQEEQQGEWIVKDQVGEIDEGDNETDRNSLNISTSSIEIESFKNEGAAERIESALENTPNESVQPPVMTPANRPSDLFVFGEQNGSAENLEMAWNEEMKCFYNKSWGGETFKLGRIQARMPRSFVDWSVSNIDKFPSRNAHRGPKHSRCLNCHERGHRVHDCPQPPKKVVCYMCGEEGHFEPRCPNKICLKCGQRAKAFKFGCQRCEQDAQMQCFVCRLKGHKAVECPDKWRRYHSTTQPAIPLTEHDKINPEKTKYCSVCAKRGHLAENCRNASRLLERPVNSLNIRSYRDAYNAQPIKQPITQPLFTILSSKVEDFDFKFGKEVSVKSNTIYGRFAKAVDLKRKKLIAVSRKSAPVATSTITSAEVVATESNASNRTEPTHRFFSEDNEAPDEACEETVSEGAEILVTTETTTQTISTDTANDSCVIIDEIVEPNAEPDPISKETAENEADNGPEVNFPMDVSEISETSLNIDEMTDCNATSTQSIDTERKLDQLKAYDSDMKQLRDLKQQLLEQRSLQTIVKEMEKSKSASNVADSTANCDSDSNYSFSEYYVGNAANKQEQQRGKPSTSASVILPDFIPLSAGTGNESEERFRETASSPEAEQSIASNSRSEAKVFLSSDHCKYLLTPTGHNFLKDKEVKHDVVIRLEWSSFGNVLCITGNRRSQEEFRTDLVGFFETLDRKIKSRSEVQIPKNRVQLIRHVSSIIRELNNLSTNNILELYHSMRRYEKPNTKSSNRKAERCRRLLNMALFGVFGFREGDKHLQAVQDILRQLKISRDINIPVAFRQTINEHLNYIFSSHPHEDYSDLIELYIEKKRSKTLPELNLDRKLLGLPIDVLPNRNASTSSNDATYLGTERFNEVSDMRPPAAIPALLDIKLNISPLLRSSPDNSGGRANEELLPQKIDGSEIPYVEANQYAFWSEKSLELIDKLKSIQSISNMTAEKLSVYERQARNYELHYAEYSKLFKTLENAIETKSNGS